MVDSPAAHAAARLYFRCLFLVPIPPVAVDVDIDVVDTLVVETASVLMAVVEVVVTVGTHPLPSM